MRFSSGVDQLERENGYLKTITKLLLLLGAALMGILFNLYDRSPVIVERSSHGLEIVRSTEFSLTEADTRSAIALMMKARFDTEAVSPEIFLNQKQLVLREGEQKELKSRNFHQNIIVRLITIKKDEAMVDVDRVLSVGDVRSALKTKLKVTFEEVQPNELNPYGLLLSLADPIESKQEK
jgi:hypothetical protein